jgi:hypothetical protein
MGFFTKKKHAEEVKNLASEKLLKIGIDLNAL